MQFTDEDRQIFRYHDGQRPRAEDPLKIQFRLGKVAADFDHTYKIVQLAAEIPKLKPGEPPDAKHIEALEHFIDMLCIVFNVKRFTDENGEPEGLTIKQIMKVFQEWGQFQAEVKSFTQPSATSQPTMEPPHSAKSETTDSSVPCTSTANGPCCEEAGPRPLESALLSGV